MYGVGVTVSGCVGFFLGRCTSLHPIDEFVLSAKFVLVRQSRIQIGKGVGIPEERVVLPKVVNV